MRVLLKILIPQLAKKTAKAVDGYKTISGGLLTLAGAGLLFVPGGQTEGIGLLITGVPTLVTGVVHKIFKHKKKGQEDGRNEGS